MKTETQIWDLEMKFKNPDFHSDKRSAYLVGYPTSKQIAYYASRTDRLILEIAKEILEDFCKVLKVKDRKEFIEDVLKVARIN